MPSFTRDPEVTLIVHGAWVSLSETHRDPHHYTRAFCSAGDRAAVRRAAAWLIAAGFTLDAIGVHCEDSSLPPDERIWQFTAYQ